MENNFLMVGSKIVSKLPWNYRSGRNPPLCFPGTWTVLAARDLSGKHLVGKWGDGGSGSASISSRKTHCKSWGLLCEPPAERCPHRPGWHQWSLGLQKDSEKLSQLWPWTPSILKLPLFHPWWMEWNIYTIGYDVAAALKIVQSMVGEEEIITVQHWTVMFNTNALGKWYICFLSLTITWCYHCYGWKILWLSVTIICYCYCCYGWKIALYHCDNQRQSMVSTNHVTPWPWSCWNVMQCSDNFLTWHLRVGSVNVTLYIMYKV